MKIALIGNMNNNFFSLLRYFHDLGADAELLMYANDGTASLSHFTPSADTWDFPRWEPLVKRIQIWNSPASALRPPLSWLVAVRSLQLMTLGRTSEWQPPLGKSDVRRVFSPYDRLIGCGIAPALLARIQRRLDVFFPYAIGVEFTGSTADCAVADRRTDTAFHQFMKHQVRTRQLKGVSAARHIVCDEGTRTSAVLQAIGVSQKKLPMPMVYNREEMPREPPTLALRRARELISTSDLSFLHSARLKWVRPQGIADEDWRHLSKNGDRVIRAFADLVRMLPDTRLRMLVLEYGPDVHETRALVTSLGIDKQVSWLPKMYRKEVLWLLDKVDVALGQFYDLPGFITCGTVWEALACGKLLIQGSRCTSEEYEKSYGYPMPPVLIANSEVEIRNRMMEAVKMGHEGCALMGARAKSWYERYSGIGAAREWLALVTGPPGSAQPATPTPC